MRHELECGHCGFILALEGALPRSTKCAVCGGIITVALPAPGYTLPPPPPPTPPPPVVALPSPIAPRPFDEPSPFPALTPDKLGLAYLDPDLRAKYLRAPWPNVLRGLRLARAAAALAVTLFTLYLFVRLVVLPLVPVAAVSIVWGALWGVASLQLIPAMTHTVGLIKCLPVPESHGRQQVQRSWLMFQLGAGWLLIFSGFALFVTPEGGEWAVLGPFILIPMFVSFACWLAFLARLGRRLGDHALTGRVGSFAPRFWVGVVVIPALAYCAGQCGEAAIWHLALALRVAAGLLALLLLRGYRALMRAACLAVARRGPVAGG